MNYSIEKITTLIGARRYGSKDGTIAFLLTDSRSLSFPEETLFFALHSERNDGHHYIDELYNRGVRNFVVETMTGHGDYPDANFLVVPSTLAALQRLAERHRDEFDIPIVGITGSNGKTMVKEWLYQLLMPSMHVTRSPRSYNSQIGVPLSIWKLHEGSAVGLFEAGISQTEEMQKLADIIQPTIGVFLDMPTRRISTLLKKNAGKSSFYSTAAALSSIHLTTMLSSAFCARATSKVRNSDGRSTILQPPSMSAAWIKIRIPRAYIILTKEKQEGNTAYPTSVRLQ